MGRARDGSPKISFAKMGIDFYLANSFLTLDRHVHLRPFQGIPLHRYRTHRHLFRFQTSHLAKAEIHSRRHLPDAFMILLKQTVVILLSRKYVKSTIFFASVILC